MSSCKKLHSSWSLAIQSNLTSVPKLIICSLLKLKMRLYFYKHGLNPFIPLCQLRRELVLYGAFFFFYWYGAVQLHWGWWFVNGSSRRLNPERGRGRTDHSKSHRRWALPHVTVESSDTELWGMT